MGARNVARRQRKNLNEPSITIDQVREENRIMWVDIGSSLEMLECLTGQNKDALKDSLGPMREKPHQNMIVLQNNNLKLE